MFCVTTSRWWVRAPRSPEEVAAYGADMRRRMLVKPDMRGLWQVSGRSALSWERSEPLDIR